MRSSLIASVAVAATCLTLSGSVLAKEAGTAPAQPGDTINWVGSLEEAFEKAASLKRPVMICINSRRVDGGRVEPAAEGLREVVYKDPRIVGKSRAFVCVFLTSEGSSGDYGELRHRFGIDGLIVSPQHIFARPGHQPGETPLVRKEYWPYGKGDPAIKALTKMMDEALAAHELRAGKPETPSPEGPDGGAPAPAPEPATPPAPDGADARQAWIDKLLRMIQNGAGATRRESIQSLVVNDKKGDCINALIALMTSVEEDKAKLPILVDLVRGLGRPGLEDAAAKINEYLKHKDDLLRANATVTLEYIGSPSSVGPLMARAKREKSWVIANHMYRALGRCGVGDAKVRALLVKKSEGSKTEKASYGPIVGLAYFHKDAKTARAVEKMLKKIGPPGGRRGGGNIMRRAMLVWTLANIQDPKSEAFMNEKMLKPIEKTESWWVEPVKTYYRAALRASQGDEAALSDIDDGARRSCEFAGGTLDIHDEARKGRDGGVFTPKADWEVEGRTFGGGRGGR